jgi:hypothetical protein
MAETMTQLHAQDEAEEEAIRIQLVQRPLIR